MLPVVSIAEQEIIQANILQLTDWSPTTNTYIWITEELGILSITA